MGGNRRAGRREFGRRRVAGTRAISDRECGCRVLQRIASIVMSMLAQLVSRGKIATLSHSLRHTDSCGVLHERAQVRGFACATHLPAD